MMNVAYKILNEASDIYTQKCCIPSIILRFSKINSLDVVCVNISKCICICRVFPRVRVDPQSYISFDDTVSFTCTERRKFSNFECMSLVFPDDIFVVKPITFKKLQVKVVLQDNVQKIQVHEEVVFKLLQNLILTKNATVKCKGQKLADLFHINCVIIYETFQDQAFGHLTETSDIEILEAGSQEHLNFLKESLNIKLGGMKDAYKSLNGYLLQKKIRSVIIFGPSGSGKSSLIKKICCDNKCSLIMIDTRENYELTIDNCNKYLKQLTSSLKYINQFNVLFINHIDEIDTSNKKEKNFFNLLLLLKQLQQTSGVSIIATASQKELLHPSLSVFFKKKLSLGIPTLNQRKEILKSVTKFHHSDEIDYEKIASLIPGFVVNDMAQLTHEAIKVNKKAKNGGGDAYNNFSLTTEDFEEALHSVSPSILKRSKWHLKVKPVYWKDIGGMQKIKERLQWGIELPLRQPEIFQNVDLDCPRGVLLFGPPGCCKTTLARGLATECNANFFAANPSQIYSSYVGDSEKNIAELFYQARLGSPSIIFLDELDSLVGSRDFATKQQGVAEKVLSTLLNEMDGLGIKTQYGENINSEILKKDCPGGESDTVRKNDVIVIAATNRPDCIDAALLRPGRFDIIVYIPPPNSEERESILQILTNGMPLQGVDIKNLANKTNNFTGADLKNLCSMAAACALKQDLNGEGITELHFMQVLEHLNPSVSTEQLQMYEQLAKKYGPIISE